MRAPVELLHYILFPAWLQNFFHHSLETVAKFCKYDFFPIIAHQIVVQNYAHF